MGPLAICLLLDLLPTFVCQSRDTLESLGASDHNASWWPL